MAVIDERLVELWQGRHSSAQELRQLYEERWINNWSLYRNTKETKRIPGQFWRSNAQIPDAFRIVETMVPQHVLSMFRNPRWFSVNAPSFPGQTYQEIVRSLLLQGWRKADGYKKTIEAMKLGNILGHFCAKTTWQVELGERSVLDQGFEQTADGETVSSLSRVTVPEVRHNGPQISVPDLFNLWQDPTGAERWWIERIPTSMDDLKESNKEFGGRLYKNMKMLETQVAINPTAKSYGGRTSFGPLSETVDGIPEQLDPDSVELWQCWGWVSPSIKKYDDTQWRLQVIANESVLLRDVPAPTHDHRPPYTNVQAIPIPGQVYGDSPLSYVGDLIELKSQIENMRRDEVLLNIYGTYAINGNAQLRGQDLFKVPGGAMRITPEMGQSLRDVIMPMPRQPVMQEAYLEANQKEQQIFNTTGATENFQGTNFGSRTTATEVRSINDVGSSRFALTTMWMDETFKKPILESMFKLYQSRMTTPELIQLAGEKGETGEIDFQDLQYDVDISVDSGLFGSMDQAQLQSMMTMMQTLLVNPQTNVYIDPGKFVKQASFRLGLDGADDFLRSDEEVAQIQQEQQQQQLLQAALAGQQGAGPAPQG